MATPSLRPTRPRCARTLLVAGLAVIVLGALSFAAGKRWWLSHRSGPEVEVDSAVHFRNAEPGVKYVGDRACAACHESIAQSYSHHPMGQSFAAITATEEGERLDGKGHSFDALGYRFLVERRGQRVFHVEQKRDSKGKELVRLEGEVRFVLGSGRQGRSYLVDHGGFLFESPISWYSSTRNWDVSPGYQYRFMHFERAISQDCLFCHANRADLVKGTFNRYNHFRGESIGCERCHGPGELHLRRHQNKEEYAPPDDTIVHPRDLEPPLRDAVCQQCHLQGEFRIVRRGRDLFDYRPSLPWHEFVSVFVRPPELTDNYKAVSHVEQLRVSRCFQASGGKMGCTSCHNPHALPAAGKSVRYYRARCLKCHTENSCVLPVDERRHRQAEDNCIPCHMPRRADANIAHTAGTDHRIPRRPEQTVRSPFAPRGIPLIHFHAKRAGERDPQIDRDLALAMIELARQPELGAMRPQIVPEAMPLLVAALKGDPDDAKVRWALAFVLAEQGRSEEAFRVLDVLLEQAPEQGMILESAANLARALDRTETALDYYRRLLKINPWEPRFHLNLARVHHRRGEWPQAQKACRDSLSINPFNVPARQLLVESLFRNGEADKARSEWATLRELEPSRADELHNWFDKLTK
jgi:Flp pilus assembly protein TadD